MLAYLGNLYGKILCVCVQTHTMQTIGWTSSINACAQLAFSEYRRRFRKFCRHWRGKLSPERRRDSLFLHAPPSPSAVVLHRIKSAHLTVHMK